MPRTGPSAWKVSRRRVNAIIAGSSPVNAAPPNPAIAEFLQLIYKNFRVRTERLPVFGDDALERLTRPVLAIVGSKDVMVDSPGIKRRLERHVPRAEVITLSDAGHFLRGQTAPILNFLRHARGA
jgi:pimeloyl-ACP methyl ester carboxylesterase